MCSLLWPPVTLVEWFISPDICVTAWLHSIMELSGPDWKPYCAARLLLAFWQPLLLLEGQSVCAALQTFVPFICLSLFFCLYSASLVAASNLFFFCPLSSSLPPLSLSLLIAHSLLCFKPSGLCSYTLVQAICWREVSYGLCVSVCVCCLVVLATCCPSLWRPSWSWWTTA